MPVIRPRPVAAGLFIFSVGYVAGCGQAHARPVAGIDGDTRLRALNDAQWESFCAYQEGLRGEQSLFYRCEGATIASDTCTGTEMPPCYDWRLDTCLGSIRGLHYQWTGTGSCDPTVAEMAACVETRAVVGCYRSLPLTPECEIAWCMGVDAGTNPSPDGS